LETLVHLDKARPPLNHGWIAIDVPDYIAVTLIEHYDLPVGWDDPFNATIAQDIGDLWLNEGKTAILRVPSVAAANDWVMALNPRHADFKRVVASNPEPLIWDVRLFGK
jgi:RES domain-containing protein